jgi:4-hydroxy-2-oxoheptanedioate aldolase
MSIALHYNRINFVLAYGIDATAGTIHAMRENPLRRLWGEGRAALNAWLTIPSAWTAELVAAAGFDAVTIDRQHGLADDATAIAMLQAISTTAAAPLVRLAWNDPAAVMRALDAGAWGVICPMVNSRAEAEAFADACRYPPHGYRSYGPIRAAVYAGDDYFTRANDEVVALALIETAEGLANAEAILTTPGLDGAYIGTIDLSLSLGLSGLGDLGDPILSEAVGRILALARRHGRVAGMHARTAAEARELAARGFGLITVMTDSSVLQTAAVNALHAARGE